MKNIYVGNIPHKSTDDELKAAFEAFGEVTSAKIITDKFTGQSRGFGFVEMPNADEAQAAIDGMNGQEFQGRPLRVNEARPRTERPDRRPRADRFHPRRRRRGRGRDDGCLGAQLRPQPDDHERRFRHGC